jgi:excinuclease ABC subunit B
MAEFELVSTYKPTGDQPRAIDELAEGLKREQRFQTLLGVTGSGKTFTMANVIQKYGRPTLIISHNKTLAAQLFGEFKAYFPNNAVEFFISYYDYYQPEAYIPVTDTYIEKDTSINDDIDRLRLRATASLLQREDVIIVASVSCIYGIGSPQNYKEQMAFVKQGETRDRDELLSDLIKIHYSRNDIDFARGTFRVRGDSVEIFPAYELSPYRVEFFGDEVERIVEIDHVSGKVRASHPVLAVYPAKHFITSPRQLNFAIDGIEKELDERLHELRSQNKLLEAQRLESRTNFDIEMMREIGYCSGIENYSRHLSGRAPGETPYTLMDFFPEEFLLIIDESHQTIPQIRGMYAGDRSRKTVLVEYGFRLPSALDNRPLVFDEFEQKLNKCIFISATPDEYELESSEGVVTEQIIRPTGLVDPEIVVKPLATQVDDLIEEIRKRVANKERVLVTTLTKRMAEDLTDYLKSLNIRVRYLHSEIDAIDRVEIIRDLRLAEFDVLVGINLLREGLDLPEVSLVAILDADKEGFLRSEKSLIQTAGRAARNVAGQVILYADKITGSMQRAIDETNRRRHKQLEYNEKHNITPATIFKSRDEIIRSTLFADSRTKEEEQILLPDFFKHLEYSAKVNFLKQSMKKAADNLEFEEATFYRDKLRELEKDHRTKSRQRR